MDGPVIQDPLPNVRAAVGQPLRLETRVAGHNLEIKWLHNSAPLNEADGIRFQPVFRTKIMAKAQPVVKCPIGTVIGLTVKVYDKKIDQFLGIPYAKPPQRFAHAEPTGYIGDVLAQAYGPCCYQPQVFPASDDAKPVAQSEDCLSLNVFRRAGTKKKDKKAVMIIIHGGGFSVGSSSDLSFYGGPLAGIGDVISVSINYRLGIFGFAHMAELTPGNLGLFDQRLAFEWVQENIKFFGGDPNRVTLIGTSAGAMSICAHIMSPVNRKDSLFHAAVIDAGVIAHEMVEHPETSFSRLKAVSRKMGCPVDIDDAGLLKFLRKADPMDLVDHSFDPEHHSPMLTFIPTADDIFISKDVGNNIRQNADNFIKIRAMIGYAKNEGTLFANYYFDGRPFPEIKDANEFLDWCAKLARAYNYPMDLRCNEELRKRVIERYYDKYATPFDAAAEFLGDGTFKCPTNAFVQSYSRYNQQLYVYQFERELDGIYFKLDPDLLGAYHFSPFLHFIGAVIDKSRPVAAGDAKRFKEYVKLVSNFAKSDATPSYRNVRWPNFAKGEGIMILDDEPSVQASLPSLSNGKYIFSFNEDENWM